MKSLNLMIAHHPYVYTLLITESVIVPLGVIVVSILGF